MLLLSQDQQLLSEEESLETKINYFDLREESFRIGYFKLDFKDPYALVDVIFSTLFTISSS